MLLGEGLGRLHNAGPESLGLDLEILRDAARSRLQALQQELDPEVLPLPRLQAICADA